MIDDSTTFNHDWLRDARRIYLSGAPAKLEDLDRAITTLEMNPSSQSHERRLRLLLHNLIGSGGSYGFPAVSETARLMSVCLHRRLDARLPVDDDTFKVLRRYLEELKTFFSSAKP